MGIFTFQSALYLTVCKKNALKRSKKCKNGNGLLVYGFLGTKNDLRNTTQAPDLITPDQVQTLHETAESAACEFLECSAKDLTSIENVCRVAVKAILEQQRKKQSQAANNSQSLCVIT